MNLSRRYPLFNEYYFKHRTPFVKSFHTHSQYEIYYFHKGKCDYLIGDEVFELESGDVIIMNGMTLHGPIVDRANEYVRSMFSFYPEIVRIFHKTLGPLNPLRPFEQLKNRRIRLRGERKTEFEAILQRIHKYYYSENTALFNRFLLAFFDLLWLIYGECQAAMELMSEEKASNGTDKERNVQKVISLIEQQYREPITLEWLEHHVFMNRHHMSRLFRELTGTTIIDYLYKFRINQAKILFILNRDCAVTDAYREVGFQSMSHFSRLFKKYVGLSPEQYRKKVQPFLLEPSALRLPVFEVEPNRSIEWS
ncbi:helix-turn-helix domain-containing protein [Paenibacillus allorhizosphaerae]|uniref:HTH-type transcriptional activator RhaR n=1 Tax=Paenibacillus allorhizosphaerae TaxID=2849866 RepID=A0ABM8VI26_9BACL|nr:AraC family transcriptional regulator [Paenibacillus allorhizosphaerae]CAG7643465.1 HTH-type transcriptional activator RhaR [Paenibacillus allorhizosphaerae]